MTTSRFIPTPSLHDASVFEALSSGVGQRQAMVLPASASASVQLVFGAPGSGKTSALVGRFIAMVEAGIPAEQILVLSATREAAAHLRDQLLVDLAAIAGSQGQELSTYAVEGPLARTTASVAFAIVKHHAVQAGLKSPELISGAEQDAIFVQLLAQHEASGDVALWPKHITKLSRGLSGFRAELRDLIAACQELGIDAAGLAALGKDKQPEWLAVSSIFSLYENLLAQPDFQHRFDSPSMVNRAIQLLSTEESGLAQYRAVLVDDAQELTPSAARFIQALLSSGSVLVLFGDPDASTLGFRQANPALMQHLATKAASTLGVSAQVINFESDPWGKPAGMTYALGRVSRPIHPAGAAGKRVAFAGGVAQTGNGIEAKVFTSPQAEAEWLAKQLRISHVQHGVAWHQMAVVARSRQILESLERLLAAESVPARIMGAQTALRDEFASRALLDLAQLVTGGFQLDALSAEQLIRSPFCGLDSVELRRFRRQLRQEEAAAGGSNNSDDLLVQLFDNPNSLETISGREGKRVRRFIKSLAAAREVAANPMATIEDLLWALWKPSGLAATWSENSRGLGEVAAQANRNLDAIVALFGAAQRYVERNPGAPMQQFIAAQLDQTVAEDSLTYNAQGGRAVSLLTPSGLVGRRFHTVAIPQLIEGIWPNLKPRTSLLGASKLSAKVQGQLDQTGSPNGDELADELRMFYKALGAANQQVFVSAYANEEEQASQFIQLVADTMPEPEDYIEPGYTLRGLAGSLRRKLTIAYRDGKPDSVKAQLASQLQRLAEAGVPGAHPDDWYGLAPISTEAPLFVFTEGEVELAEGEIDEEYAIGGDKGSRIPIYPSQLENFLKCPLHWFLESHGAKDKEYEAQVGTLIHQAMELATENTEDSLWQYVDSRWHTIRHESAWLEEKERRRAKNLVRNLASYLADFDNKGGKLIGNEIKFEFNAGKAVVQGRIDRVEQLKDGRVVIADLKTGKTKPAVKDMPQHAQLGLYQLALKNPDLLAQLGLTSETEMAGAKLIFIIDDKPSTRDQAALTQEAADDFQKVIDQAVESMALDKSKTFIARVSNHCEKDGEFGTCKMHLVKAVSYNA